MTSLHSWDNHCFWAICYFISGNEIISCILNLTIHIILSIESDSREGSTTTYKEALMYASGILIFNGLQTFSSNQYFMFTYHNAMKVRVAVCSLIYRKVNSQMKITISHSVSFILFILFNNSRYVYHKRHLVKRHRAK